MLTPKFDMPMTHKGLDLYPLATKLSNVITNDLPSLTRYIFGTRGYWARSSVKRD